MSLIAKLNEHLGKTPDEVVAAVSDPLCNWQCLTTAVTQELYDLVRNRQIVLFYHNGDETNPDLGFFCTNRQYFPPDRPYSYRTMMSDHAEVQQMSAYPPSNARDCAYWWFIGAEFRNTTPPTTAAEPSQPYEDDDEPEEDFYDEEPDYDA